MRELQHVGWMLALAMFGLLACFHAPLEARAAGSGTDYFNLAQSAAKHGNYREAVVNYQQAILHGHNNPETYVQLGLAYKETKQLDFAAWAIAKALSDPVFSVSSPDAVKQLTAVESAGGSDTGAPPSMQSASMTPDKSSPELAAQQEAASAWTVFQDPLQAYFVAPGLAPSVNIKDMNTIVDFANNASNDSSTVTKFVFLDAVPAPYTKLADYAQDLLTKLSLQKGIVVVVTPRQAAAASNRLGTSTVTDIVSKHMRAAGTAGLTQSAIAIAGEILQKANDDDRTATIRTAAVVVLGILAALALLALSIIRITRRPHTAKHKIGPHGYAAPRKRNP